jgi:hypothetical protein
MSFLEMSKLMCDSWKNTDKFGQSIFQELAVEGRMQHKQRVAEYNEMYPSAAAAGSSSPSPKKKAKKTFRRHSMDIMISDEQIKNLRVNDPSVHRTRNIDVPSYDHHAVGKGNGFQLVSPSPKSVVRASFFNRRASCGAIPDIPSFSVGDIRNNAAAPTNPPPPVAPAELDNSIDSIDIEQEASDFGNPTASSFEDDKMLNSILRQNEEKHQPEASADDFLKLIATLNNIG